MANLLKANITIAEGLDDKELVGMFYAWLGFMLYGTEELNEAYRYLIKALELGNKIESPKVKGYAFTWLSWNCAELGLLDEAVSHGKAAQQIAGSLTSDPYLYFKSLGGIGHAHYFSGKSRNNNNRGFNLIFFRPTEYI